MSPDEVLQHLRRIRFSPRAGRPTGGLVYLARQAGYTDRALFRVIHKGRITPDMARRLSQPIARLVVASGGDNSPTLGRYGADDAAGKGHRGDWYRPTGRKPARYKQT